VGKLFLLGTARYFGCRHCHELTSRSAQTHDKGVDAFRRHPELVAALLATPERCSLAQPMLLLKTIDTCCR
jgi:hypothetical protein